MKNLMNLMRMLLVAFVFIAFTSVFTSCEKEDVEPDPISTNQTNNQNDDSDSDSDSDENSDSDSTSTETDTTSNENGGDNGNENEEPLTAEEETFNKIFPDNEDVYFEASNNGLSEIYINLDGTISNKNESLEFFGQGMVSYGTWEILEDGKFEVRTEEYGSVMEYSVEILNVSGVEGIKLVGNYTFKLYNNL